MRISSEKQMVMLDYLMLKYPQLTVGKALFLLHCWSYRLGTQLNIKG